MALQRRNLHHRSRPAPLALLLVVLGLTAACDRAADGPSPPPERIVRTGLTPLPLPEFEPVSDEQRTLRGAANDALRAGDEATAITALIALERSTPRSEAVAVSSLLLAQLYHENGDLDRSLETLEALIAWAPPSAEIEFLHATTLLDLGRASEAAEALRRAVRINPDYLRAYPLLAALLESLEQTEGAEETLLALERRVLRLARELDETTRSERKLEILAQLRIGFPQADAARAAVRALDDEDPDVVEAALDTLERVGTPVILGELESFASSGMPGADRAARIASSLAR